MWNYGRFDAERGGILPGEALTGLWRLNGSEQPGAGEGPSEGLLSSKLVAGSQEN